MWYLIDIDDGVLASAPTKKELSGWWTQCKRQYRINGKYVYEVRSGGDGYPHHLYSSRRQAEEDGFGFAVKVHDEGGEECDTFRCPYNLYGYCSKEPPVKENEVCYEL